MASSQLWYQRYILKHRLPYEVLAPHRFFESPEAVKHSGHGLAPTNPLLCIILSSLEVAETTCLSNAEFK
jgi:hypothetical protein